LVDLAVSIAEQVLHGALSAQPEHVLNMVRKVVQMHGDSNALLTLRVHPEDRDLIERYLNQEGGLKRWHVLADEQIQAGGCQAQTASGSIDATLQTRWRKVVESLGMAA